MFKSIISAFRKRAIYNSTFKELSMLTDRELYDLGIERSQIEMIARESAYGKEKVNTFDENNRFPKTRETEVEKYLSEAIDAVDLENRIKNLDRGLAPWQVRAKVFSQTWVI